MTGSRRTRLPRADRAARAARVAICALAGALVAPAAARADAEPSPGDPLEHATVDGPAIAHMVLARGKRTENVVFDELAVKRLEPGLVTLSFTAEGRALRVPWCGGRRAVRVAGREVRAPGDAASTRPTAASGPFVAPLPGGRVDVAIDVVVSPYERRVACGEAPRAGEPGRGPWGFSSLAFPSPSTARGGGVAAVYVPKAHDRARPASVLVGVHPWNGGIWTYAQYTHLVQEAERLDVVLLHPSGLGNSLYVAEAEAEVMRALEALGHALPVDPRRVSIWGASMGGAGATTIGLHRPDRFASVTSFFGDARYDLSTYVRSILHDEAGAHAVNALDVIDNARHVPIWLVHGEADRVSPIRQSELLDQALRARGFAVRFDRAPGVGHEGRLVERFAAEVVRRAAVAVAPEHPARVTFRSVRAEDTSTYGVRLERAGASDAFVDLEGKDGRVVVHAASGVRAVVLKPGALGVASGAPVEKSGPDTVPVRWE
ncbi:MAG: prolyl oligopeptidase family serine peptidase [Myxococcales bacterium]|nr:prolyl oligopeptidase family serine peptidase [Myxococcales bacterium]MBL0194456.1 prolyl oligopeptidase family serine peptidase [Myxococcales bacterium]